VRETPTILIETVSILFDLSLGQPLVEWPGIRTRIGG